MANESAMQTLGLDPPVQLVATYRMDLADRQYLDQQVRFTQKALHETALVGYDAHWSWIDPAAETVQPGDALCVSSTGDHETAYLRRATTSALSDAGTVLGVAVTEAGPGGRVLVATAGHLPRKITGLTVIGYVTYVRVTAAGRLEQTTTPTGETIVGRAEPNGRMTIALGSEALGGSLAVTNDWKESARFAITSALPAYTRTGNTIEANANGAIPTQDGVPPAVNDRALLAVGTSVDNGIWVFTALGSGGSKWAMARASDADSSGDVTVGLRIGVTSGTNNKGVWQLITADPITLNTTPLTFQKDQGIAPGTANGQVAIWNGTTWTAGAVDLADPDAVVPGGANQVYWSNGTTNSWTGSPTVTNLTVTALLTAGALAFGADPPETGTLRFSHLTNIVGEASTPGADIPLLEWGNYVANRLSLGHSSLGVLHLRAGTTAILDGSNMNVWSAGSAINVYVADTQWASSVASPRLVQLTKTDDTAPQNFTITPQAPWASATGANRKPGSFVVALAQPSAGGTETPLSQVTYAGSFTAGLGPRSSAHTASALWLGPALTPSSTNYALSSSASAATTSLNATTTLSLGISGNTYASLTTTLLTLDTATITWTEASTPQIAQIAWGSDNAPRSMTLAPQAPWASATGANRTPGSLVVALAAPTNSGTTEAGFKVTRGGSLQCQIGAYNTPPTYTAVWLGPGIVPSLTNFAFLGDGTGNAYLNAPSGGTVYISTAGTSVNGINVSATTVNFASPALVQWGQGVTGPRLGQATRTGDAAPQSMSIAPQAPFATATGTNRIPGSLFVDIAAPTNGGTTEAALIVTRGGAGRVALGVIDGTPTVGALWLGGNAGARTSSNYTLYSDGSSTHVNTGAGGAIRFCFNGGTASTVWSDRIDATPIQIGRTGTMLSFVGGLYVLSAELTLDYAAAAAGGSLRMLCNGNAAGLAFNNYYDTGQARGEYTRNGSAVAMDGLYNGARGIFRVTTYASANAGDALTGAVVGLQLSSESTDYIALGATPAAAGQVRLQNAATVRFRNAGNTADISVLQVDASNNVLLGANSAITYLDAGSTIYFRLGGATSVTLNASYLLLTQTNLQWTAATSAPLISQEVRTTDTLPQALKLSAQYPYASATGANRQPGLLILDFGAPTNSGTAESGVAITRSGSRHCQIGPYNSPPTLTSVWLGPGISPTTTNFALACDGTSITYLNVPSGGTIYLSTNGTGSNGMSVTSGVVQLNSPTVLRFAKGVAAPEIGQEAPTTDAAAQALVVSAQRAYASASTNLDGGILLLRGGAEKGSAAGKKGGVRIQLNGTTETMIEAVEVAIGRRVIVFGRGSDITTTQMPSGTGDGVVYLANAATARSTGVPVGGGILEAGGGHAYWTDEAGITSQLD